MDKNIKKKESLFKRMSPYLVGISAGVTCVAAGIVIGVTVFNKD